MMQLAHEAGKRKCPSRVNGYDNTPNRIGGITNRSLVKVRAGRGNRIKPPLTGPWGDSGEHRALGNAT